MYTKCAKINNFQQFSTFSTILTKLTISEIFCNVYEHLRNKLEDLQKEMAAKQTSMVNLKSNEGQMPTGTEFPDRSFGRKQKRSITKQKSLLK